MPQPEAGVSRGPFERVQLGTIKTLEGWMLVKPGDYIVRGVHGEHYACKPDIFAKTYECIERGGHRS